MVNRICKSVVVILGFVLAGVGLLLGFYVFPKLVDSKLDDSVKLVNGTEAYDRWENIPLPLQFKVYFFNITNVDEVQKGAIPIVKEVGPYVYNQERKKVDISKDDDTFAYRQNQLFTFNENASATNKENDKIIVPNLLLMATITTAEEKGFLDPVNRSLNAAFYNPKNLFLTTTPRDFLYDGIYINCALSGRLICNKIKSEKIAQVEEAEGKRLKFSFLSYKNNTDDGRYKVESGEKNVEKLGNIIEWNDSPQLSHWKENSTCNELWGTDATIFPPHQTQSSKLHVFQSDVCRTFVLEYSEEIKYKEVSGLRYVLRNDTLHSGANYSANSCYCLNKTRGLNGEKECLLDGALELISCQKSPVVLTFPHFYLAHQDYKNTIKGFEPKPEKHETFAELEPRSGTILRGSKRVQFNIFYRKFEKISLTDNLANTLMPVLWLDEGLELSDKYINLLDDSLFYPMMILEAVYWTLIAIGLAVGLIGMVWCMIFSNKPKEML